MEAMMTCDYGSAPSEFSREDDPLDSLEPLQIIARAQAVLTHYAADALTRYDGEFERGRQLPAMELRGLIGIMQIEAQNLNVALGRLTRPR
jgi:hypothetical protein